MIHTDEDDEFARIERENRMKGQPYHFAQQRKWVGLTDEELLQAYGWRLASGAPNWLLEEAKQELLGALRKVEASIKEKNT
jgi:predicted DNA-binding transcriptional regulator